MQKPILLKEKFKNSENIILSKDSTIQQLEQDQAYTYLGIQENHGIQHSEMKSKIIKEYKKRLRLICQSELKGSNKFRAINTLAVPVLTYSFNVVNWKLSEIKNIDRKTRKILTMNRIHHPKSDVERLYLQRSCGGRGLIQIESHFKVSSIGLQLYLKNKEEKIIKEVLKHENTKKVYSVTKSANKFETELQLTNISHTSEKLSAIKIAKKQKEKAKIRIQSQMKDKWLNKPLHGQFPKRLQLPEVSENLSNKWLKSSGLKSETEGFIIAAQDQSLLTKNYIKNIMKQGTSDLCRLCKKYVETVDHIISGCPVLANTEYLDRHNKVAAYIHWRICKKYNINVVEKWYDHKPESVVENKGHVTILWDYSIHTDKTISANRPDITIKDKDANMCYLIDVSTPCDKNVTLKLHEKISKYKNLEIEISKLWKIKAKTIPVIIGSLGIMTSGSLEKIKHLPVEVHQEQLQKITLLGTARILRRFLS